MENIAYQRMNKQETQNQQQSKSDSSQQTKSKVYEQWDQQHGNAKLQPSNLEKQQKWDEWDKRQGQIQYSGEQVKQWTQWDQRHSSSLPTKPQWEDWDKKNLQLAKPNDEESHISKPQVMMWNSQSGDYKLMHYNYFQDNLDKSFAVQHYMKLHHDQMIPPQQRHYMRFEPSIYVSEIPNKSTNHYSSIMEDEKSAQKFIYNKVYRGVYSQQHDYFRFSQETKTQNIQRQHDS